MNDEERRSDANASLMLALATRIEGKGQYNVAKLLRAAAEATARRSAYRLGLSPDLDGIVADLERVVAMLPAQGASAELVDAPARGRDAVRAGTQTLLEEFPDPFVCRRCGGHTLGAPRAICATCNAWPTTHQRFRGGYWLDEFDPVTALQVMSAGICLERCRRGRGNVVAAYPSQ